MMRSRAILLSALAIASASVLLAASETFASAPGEPNPSPEQSSAVSRPVPLTMPLEQKSPTLWSVSAIGADDAWTVGTNGGRGGAPWDPFRPIIRHWDGTSWTKVASPRPGGKSRDTYLSSVSAVSASDVWAVGYFATRGRQLTLTEHWDGTSWTKIDSPNLVVNSALFGVKALSASDVWAVGSYSPSGGTPLTLIEHWDGTSWTVVPSPNRPGGLTQELLSVSAVSASDIWAVGVVADADGNIRTLTQHWDGTSWIRVPSPNPGRGTGTRRVLTAVTAVATNDVWAVGFYDNYTTGDFDKTLILHWDGSAWTKVQSPNPGGSAGFNNLSAVSAAAADDVWAVGDDSLGMLIEHWDGTRWTKAGPDQGTILYGVSVSSSDDVWAVGHGWPTDSFEHWDGTRWTES